MRKILVIDGDIAAASNCRPRRQRGPIERFGRIDTLGKTMPGVFHPQAFSSTIPKPTL